MLKNKRTTFYVCNAKKKHYYAGEKILHKKFWLNFSLVNLSELIAVKKSYVLLFTPKTYKMAIAMQETEAKIKNDLLVEIQALENNYGDIKKFLSSPKSDMLQIGESLSAFKDGLNRTSAFIMALYTLHGQKVKIPWEPLFTSLDYALATINVTPTAKQAASLRAILGMSASQIEQVMVYLLSLKESIK